MDATTVKTRLKSGGSLILIDVRDAAEVVAEPYFVVLPKNYLNLPMLSLLFASKEELQAKIFEALKLPTDTPIVTLCHSGNRSERACKELQQHGWQVENLEGGIIAWGDPL